MESPRGDSRSKEALFLLRPAEVAALLGLNRNTICRRLRHGTLTRIRLGGSTFVNGQELLDRLAVVRERPAVYPELRSRVRALLRELQARGTRSSACRSA